MGDDSLTWEPVVEGVRQIITLQAADLHVVYVVVYVLWHAALPVLYADPAAILLQGVVRGACELLVMGRLK